MEVSYKITEVVWKVPEESDIRVKTNPSNLRDREASCEPAAHTLLRELPPVQRNAKCAKSSEAYASGSTISQSSWLRSTHEALSAGMSGMSQSPCAATRLSRASVAEMTDIDIAIRGPIARILRPRGDSRMRVSIAVRYKSGSRFFVHGREGRSGRDFCTGARGEDRRGLGAVRRDVRIMWDDDALSTGET